jgi:signal peptidase I
MFDRYDEGHCVRDATIEGPNMRHAENRDADNGFNWRDTLIWCGIPVAIVLLVRMFLIGFYVIPSGSMMDTIEPGDRVITSKLTPKVFPLQRGDIVVFKDPDHWLQEENSGHLGGDYLIKRLIGLPGDTVACEGPGKPITINGVAIDESSYIRPGVDPSSFAFKVKVTAGHIFVLGDNRANSADSRYHQDDSSHGLVPISDVVGVGLATYWPLNRIGLLSAHHDVFKDVPEGSTD